MKFVKLYKAASPGPVVRVKYCDTFFSNFLGLMFKKDLEPDGGVLLVENRESRLNTAIHMLFMNFDLAVLWLDADLVVVDKVLARKWVPLYVPRQPAQYVAELHPSRYSEFEVGEQLALEEQG